MGDYLSNISVSLGIPLWIFVIALVWEICWKLSAMWIAAKKNSLAWFIVLAVINTVGILPIIYIFGISKYCGKKRKVRKR